MYQSRKAQFDEDKAQAQKDFANTIHREGLNRDLKIANLTIQYNRDKIGDINLELAELDK